MEQSPFEVWLSNRCETPGNVHRADRVNAKGVFDRFGANSSVSNIASQFWQAGARVSRVQSAVVRGKKLFWTRPVLIQQWAAEILIEFLNDSAAASLGGQNHRHPIHAWSIFRCLRHKMRHRSHEE